MAVDITDIRDGGELANLASGIRSGLTTKNEDGHLSLPSLLLWNEQGLKCFEEVTYSPQYYLTNTEIALLEAHSKEIAEHIEAGSVLVELGSGALRKTEILLNAFEELGKAVDYYALDLDQSELERTLRELNPARFEYVRCHGLLGTYEDGRAWIAKPMVAARPRCILSLGSTMGSFTREEAREFWGDWSKALQRRDSPVEDLDLDSTSTRIVIGLDATKDGDKVYGAYNDEGGANRRFILNALGHANTQLAREAFDKSQWSQHGEWNAVAGRHDQYLVPDQDVEFEGTTVRAGEKVFLVSSYKWDQAEQSDLWFGSQLKEMESFMNSDRTYGLHVLAPS